MLPCYQKFSSQNPGAPPIALNVWTRSLRRECGEDLDLIPKVHLLVLKIVLKALPVSVLRTARHLNHQVNQNHPEDSHMWTHERNQSTSTQTNSVWARDVEFSLNAAVATIAQHNHCLIVHQRIVAKVPRRLCLSPVAQALPAAAAARAQGRRCPGKA